MLIAMFASVEMCDLKRRHGITVLSDKEGKS